MLPLSLTKKRLKEEFDRGAGFAWITKGREIENYLDHDKVEQIVKEVHPSAINILEKSHWSNLLKYKNKKGQSDKTASKVKDARLYVERNEPDFRVLDLDKMLDKLCTFISFSNNNEI